MPELPRYLPCDADPIEGHGCDGATGDDVDPDYYCVCGIPWQDHEDNPEYLEDVEVRATEDRIEARQARWSETGSSRRS